MLMILTFLIVVVVVLSSIATTPPYHFDVLSVLGARLRGKKGVLREGLNFIIPFISSRERISMELVKNDIKFAFTTKDGFRLQAEGVFQYRPDPDVLFPKEHPDHGRNVFVTVSEETILAGVTEAVEARLGGVGGKNDHTVFIESRQALGDIVNAILRMKKPYHLMHKKGTPAPIVTDDPNSSEFSFCGKNDCPYNEPVEAEQLVQFYNFHWHEIRTIREAGSGYNSTRSEIELRYGINTETFDLGNISFTEETEAALEEEKQAVARSKAADKRLEIAQKYRKLGLSPKDAADESDLLMDPKVTKSIVSTQGDAGIFGGLLGIGKGGK